MPLMSAPNLCKIHQKIIKICNSGPNWMDKLTLPSAASRAALLQPDVSKWVNVLICKVKRISMSPFLMWLIYSCCQAFITRLFRSLEVCFWLIKVFECCRSAHEDLSLEPKIYMHILGKMLFFCTPYSLPSFFMRSHTYASQISSHSAESCSENPQAASATQIFFLIWSVKQKHLSHHHRPFCARFNAEWINQNAAEDVNYKYKLGPAEKQNHT